MIGLKKWRCPCCHSELPQTLEHKDSYQETSWWSRRPPKAENDYYSNRSSSYHPHQRHYPHGPSFSSTVAPKKEDFQGSDLFDSIIPILCKNVEFYDLVRRLPSQQHVTVYNNILSCLALFSLSGPNTFQKNNNEGNQLPAGYSVRFCNTCLRGNCLESIFASCIELEALTRTRHTCETESVRPSIIHQNMIMETQEKLLSYFKQVVNLRIGHQQGRTRTVAQVSLKAHKLLLQHIGNKELSNNKSWIGEEDYIDLRKISRPSDTSTENQDHWPYRLIKEKGFTKIIRISEDELSEFIGVCKSTFGAFQIQIDDETRRYFVVSIIL